MPATFTPNFAAWYWSVQGKTNVVFSSASGTYVPTTDTTYQAWLAVNGGPLPIDTEQNLLQVLAVRVPGLVMQTTMGLVSYARSRQAAIAAGGISVNVGTTASPINVEASTDTASLILLQGAASIASANPGQSFQWVPANGNPITLTAAQMTTMFSAVSSFLQATFSTLSGVMSAINAGTITTKAQVDNPPSPIPAWPANS